MEEKVKFDREELFKTAENKKKPGRKPIGAENKKQISISVPPYTYDAIKKIAYVDRKSVSGIISEFMDKFVEMNAEKLEEYKKLKGE